MGTVGQRGGGDGRARGEAAALALAAVIAVIALGGCGGHTTTSSHPDARDAAMSDAREASAETRDTAPEALAPDVAACKAADAGSKKAMGATCGCASDCASNFCVDGVCCGTACTEACKTCAAAGSAGTCTFLVSGTKPREETACVPAS